MSFRKIDATGTVPRLRGTKEPLMHVAQSMYMVGYNNAVKNNATEKDVEKQRQKLNCIGDNDWVFAKKKTPTLNQKGDILPPEHPRGPDRPI